MGADRERLSRTIQSDVSRETCDALERYVGEILAENQHQNLISPSSEAEIWQRHIIDCAQLVPLGRSGNWLDIGSGAGLPGIVIAILTGQPMALVEPRRLRAQFLQRLCDSFNLKDVTVRQERVARTTGQFDTITARAVAASADLLAMASHLARPETLWVLPRGRTAEKELDEVRKGWHGEFRLEASRTDPGAAIIVARGVRAKGSK